MTNFLRFVRGPILASVAALGLASCNMDVTNPSVIDAGTFDPTTDGKTLALSAQTNFYIAFQSVALYGGLISDELWTGAIRLQTNRLASRTFAGSDDINVDFFAPLSLAVASNENAVTALAKGPAADTDLNLARASMNFAYSVELMAETMCSGVIQGGPELSDTQLLDTAVTAFTKAVSTATAEGAGGTDIVNESNVGLARTYLQLGDYTHAAATAALVPSDFVANVITTGNVSTQGTLGKPALRNYAGWSAGGSRALSSGRPAHADRQYHSGRTDAEWSSLHHPDEVHELRRPDPARIRDSRRNTSWPRRRCRVAAERRRHFRSSTRGEVPADSQPTAAPPTISRFSRSC